MTLHASRIAATVGAAFLLTSVVSAPAQAMLAPFDPAPASAIGLGSTTPHCFMGHESWPAAVQPQEPCTR